MPKSYWIKKENVTDELLQRLKDLGYSQDQRYFSEENSDIIFTTNISDHKTFTFANYEQAYQNGNPRRTWLYNLRDEIKTANEMIKLI